MLGEGSASLTHHQLQTGHETLRQVQGKLFAAHLLAVHTSFERTGPTQRAADWWESPYFLGICQFPYLSNRVNSVLKILDAITFY